MNDFFESASTGPIEGNRFGSAAKDYANHRKGFPDLAFDELQSLGVGWDIAVNGLPLLTQAEIRKLFSVLDSNFILSLTPRLLTGVPAAWDDSKEIDEFLNNWRFSDPKSLITGNELRVGYMGMVEITMACWYANPRSWDFCGYTGPPVL